MNKFTQNMKHLAQAFGTFVFIAAIIIACDSGFDGGDGGSPYTGKGGSLARFAISNGHLYTVAQNKLTIYNLDHPENPAYSQTKSTNAWELETIFPFGNYLFLGTPNGMFIYSTQTPSRPEQVSFYQHIVSCDPVVTDGTYAYITLSTSRTRCANNNNLLQIVNIKDIENPKLAKEFDMQLPKGLGVSDSLLFVCDDGLKVYDKSKAPELTLLHHYTIPANDVIPFYGTLIVTADDGIHQYSYQGTEINKLSSID